MLGFQEVAQESLRVAHEQRLALEETLERRSREVAALHQHNYTLRLTANNALAELQVPTSYNSMLTTQYDYCWTILSLIFVLILYLYLNISYYS